jgi:hypothetical protein
MNVISWLISRIIQFFLGTGEGRKNPSVAMRNKAGAHDGQTAAKTANFDADYRNATKILKSRIDARFPDNFHARVGSETNSARDYGDERASAIDTASATIASALRRGATAKQAAEAGAASVGI